MSWSPELFIGELRPWPESVCVIREGEEAFYFPELTCKMGEAGKDLGMEIVNRYICTACGRSILIARGCAKPDYCPMCGAKVVDE